MEKLTKEQEQALGKLLIRHTIGGFFIGVKFGLYFGAAVLLTALLNTYYVKNEEFQFGMGMVNAVFLVHFFILETRKHRESLKEKVEKIIKKDS